MNSNGVSPDWATARNNRKLASHQDILACEGGFFYGDLNAQPMWKASMAAKLLEAEASAAGTPTLIFGCIGHKPWTYFCLPPAEVKLMWASCVSNRAGTWLSVMKDEMRHPSADVVQELYAFARANRQDLFETRSLAQAAIMVSKAR